MSGPGVAGGGSIAVETGSMVEAAHRLALTAHGLGTARARTAALVGTLAPGARRSHAEDALVLLGRAGAQADVVAEGLRTAATRYGVVEQAILVGERGVAAALAAAVGNLARMTAVTTGPLGGAAVVLAAGALGGLFVVDRSLRRLQETGRFAPQSDPVLLRALALVLASLDDGVRGALLIETPRDLLQDDPAGRFGSEEVAAVLAGLLLHPAGTPLNVRRTRTGSVHAPHALAELADRLPDGGEPAGQVRIERYDGPGGVHWIVSIAGTVTFAPDSGDEPFDLASDVLGVAHRPSDSERAVLQAMALAGVGRDEPVLLVGHSQGALDAVRVAQDGGYRVDGVVQFGGPTGQMVLPADVPVLAVEHDEDLVPVLGGTAATGAEGLRRTVVRRSLPDGGFGVPTSPATAMFPAHDLAAYRRTLAQAEASDDTRVAAFRRRIAPFVDGAPGESTRWHAERVRPDPVPTAAGGSGRRPTR